MQFGADTKPNLLKEDLEVTKVDHDPREGSISRCIHKEEPATGKDDFLFSLKQEQGRGPPPYSQVDQIPYSHPALLLTNTSANPAAVTPQLQQQVQNTPTAGSKIKVIA